MQFVAAIRQFHKDYFYTRIELALDYCVAAIDALRARGVTFTTRAQMSVSRAAAHLVSLGDVREAARGASLKHYPLNEVPDGYVNIHGHVHDDPPRRTPHINVSVEQLDYAPVPLTALRALARVLVRGEYPEGNTTLARLQVIGHTP